MDLVEPEWVVYYATYARTDHKMEDRLSILKCKADEMVAT